MGGLGDLCSQRLKAAPLVALDLLTQPLEDPFSARQMDRRLRETKHIVKRRLYGTTRPGSLKQMIPDHWDVNRPGYLEIDLVSHSGASAVGEFVHSLDCVDIATCWVERKAVMGKSALGVLNAVTEIEHQLPFPLKGIDSDNGSDPHPIAELRLFVLFHRDLELHRMGLHLLIVMAVLQDQTPWRNSQSPGMGSMTLTVTGVSL